MDAEKITKAAQATLSGTLSFSEGLRLLMEEGVEYYHADFSGMALTYHGEGAGVVRVPLLMEGMPEIGPDFKLDALRAAIVDSQSKGQKFRDFCRRAMNAGVQGYFAFLRGQRVIYFGRQGDLHTEWFPGAKPSGH